MGGQFINLADSSVGFMNCCVVNLSAIVADGCEASPSHSNLVFHPSIFYCLILQGVTPGLEPIPADTDAKVWDNLYESLVHHRADIWF